MTTAELEKLEGLEKAYSSAHQPLTTEPTADTLNQWSAALREYIPALHRSAPALFAALRSAWDWNDKVNKQVADLAARIASLEETGKAAVADSERQAMTPAELEKLERVYAVIISSPYPLAVDSNVGTVLAAAPRLFAELREAWNDADTARRHGDEVAIRWIDQCVAAERERDALKPDAALFRRIEREKLQVTTDHNGNRDVERFDPPAASLDPDLRAALAQLPEVKP